MPREHGRSIAGVGRRPQRRRSRGVLGGLPAALLTACAAPQTGGPPALRPATERLVSAGAL